MGWSVLASSYGMVPYALRPDTRCDTPLLARGRSKAGATEWPLVGPRRAVRSYSPVRRRRVGAVGMFYKRGFRRLFGSEVSQTR